MSLEPIVLLTGGLASAALGRALTCSLLVAEGLKDGETFQVCACNRCADSPLAKRSAATLRSGLRACRVAVDNHTEHMLKRATPRSWGGRAAAYGSYVQRSVASRRISSHSSDCDEVPVFMCLWSACSFLALVIVARVACAGQV